MLFGFNGISQTKNSKKKLNEVINTTTSKNKKDVIDNADIDANLKQRIKQTLKENDKPFVSWKTEGKLLIKIFYIISMEPVVGLTLKIFENRTQEIR